VEVEAGRQAPAANLRRQDQRQRGDRARAHKNILAKLKVSDRTEAMNVAIRRGIIHIG